MGSDSNPESGEAGSDWVAGRSLTGAARNERDARLITAFRAGDAAALDELFAWYQPLALKYAIRYATELVPAEDIVSEAWLKMIQALRNGKGPTVSTWWYLVAAMKSVTIDQGIVNARVQPISDDQLELALEETADETPEEFANATVIEAFNRLSKRWQSVIWYRDIAGYSVEETGDLLGLTANAVGTLYSRARKAFRTEYLRTVAKDDRMLECLPFAEALVQYGEAGKPEDAALSRHLDGCSSCESKITDLSRMRLRFASALLVAAPGLVFHSPHGGDLAALALTHSADTRDPFARFENSADARNALSVPTKIVTIGVSLLSVVAMVLMLPQMEGSGVEPSGTWGQEPTTQEKKNAIPLTVAADHAKSDGPLPLRSSSSRADGASSSLVSCPMYFEPSVGNRMAFFEQWNDDQTVCRVELIRPNGDIVQMSNGPSPEFVQVTRAGTYLIRIQKSGRKQELFQLTLSPEQIVRTER